jgi:PKD repeat protein
LAFPVVNSFYGSGFTYLYASLYYPFGTLGQDRPDLVAGTLRYPVPVNWWTNAVNAVSANRQFTIDRSVYFPFSFHANSWGLSAVERPDGSYEGLYGALPTEYGPTHDGTVAVYLMFSSMPFFRTADSEALSENLSFQAIRYGYEQRYNNLFGEYGPVDSINDRAEFSTAFLGLDQGPILLSIENYRSSLLWETLMRSPKVAAAMGIVFGHAPVIASVLPQTVQVGETVTFTLTASDADQDPDIVISSSNLPSGATLESVGPGESRFSWTPGFGDVGSFAVAFLVRDRYRVNPDPLLVSITVNQVPPPVAAFSAEPVSGTTPLTVGFTDASSGLITTRAWDFGDGTTSADTNPQHTYVAAGTFTVRLTVTGPGGSSTETKGGYITVTNVPPPTPKPKLSFAAFPPVVPPGWAAILVWHSSGADACEASSVPQDTRWKGPKATEGLQLVWPRQTTAYSLTCRSTGGTVTKRATVTVRFKRR